MSKVAILTGAATGMGRGVAEDLASKGWKVVILDYNSTEGQKTAEKIDGDFFQVDVRSWSAQFNAFDKTFKRYGRLDFVFANAGVPDPEDYFAIDATNFSAEKPPNLSVLDIDLVGISYTSLLALSFFRQSTTSGGLIVMTSSGAGIYPTPVQPFYAAAKHGVTGLARSMGQRVETEGIRVCALVPGLVPTTIMPQEILDRTDRAIMTPISHIVAAINDMLESDRNATVCEASVDKLWYRDPPPFLDDAQRRVITEVSKGMGPDFKKVRVEKEGKVAAQKVQ